MPRGGKVKEDTSSDSADEQDVKGLANILKVFKNVMGHKSSKKKQSTVHKKIVPQKKTISHKQANAFWTIPGQTFKKTRFILIAFPAIQKMSTGSVANIITIQTKIKRNQITAITRADEIDGYILLANEDIVPNLTHDGRCIAITYEHLGPLKNTLKLMTQLNFNDTQREYNRPGYIALKLLNESLELDDAKLAVAVISPMNMGTQRLLNIIYEIRDFRDKNLVDRITPSNNRNNEPNTNNNKIPQNEASKELQQISTTDENRLATYNQMQNQNTEKPYVP
ncbi:hypothetical protein GINT2_000677 [Glugoides intestinalis]